MKSMRLWLFLLLIALLAVPEKVFHPEHPFKIDTVRQVKIKPHTRIFQTIQKALGLESHTIHELTVLVSSDKINKQGENK